MDVSIWGLALALGVLTVIEMVDSVEAWRLPRTWIAGSGRNARCLISVHVPISSEPPELVLTTLTRLTQLDYPRFEVIVVDNNTDDARLWLPIAAFCEARSPQFRFIHVERLSGAKAGALNLALADTHPEADAIAVVDSDYLLDEGFLSVAAGLLASDGRVAVVQAPQDYRDIPERGAARGRFFEYGQFFAAGMRVRARRNAILMHGTMSLVRVDALRRAGGWSEWCVTEDSELGLRLLAAGHRTVYLEESYGKGLMPFTARDYVRQRRRWVTGGAQTLRHHWRSLCGLADTQLTAAQRLHYMQGWAPWMRDGLQVLALAPVGLGLTGTALGWTRPSSMVALSISLGVVFLHILVRQALLMPRLLRTGFRDSLRMVVTTVGLMWPIGTSWISGVFTGRGRFIRTPKDPAAARIAMPSDMTSPLVGVGLVVVSALLWARTGMSQGLPLAGLFLGAQLFAGAYGYCHLPPPIRMKHSGLGTRAGVHVGVSHGHDIVRPTGNRVI